MHLTDPEIRAIAELVEKVVRKVLAEQVPPDTAMAMPKLVAGPDERGRIQYDITQEILPDHWFLDPLALRRHDIKDQLNESQIAHIRENVGCSDDGVLGTMGPLRNRLDKKTNFVSPCFEVVQGGLTVKDPGSYNLTSNGLMDKPTLGNRNESYQELINACNAVRKRLGA